MLPLFPSRPLFLMNSPQSRSLPSIRPFIFAAFLLTCAAPRLDAESVNSVGMTMVADPGGQFRDGSGETKSGLQVALLRGDRPGARTGTKHRCAGWRSARRSRCRPRKVTNAQYEMFEPDHRKTHRMSKRLSTEDDAAVVNVNWEDAARFLPVAFRKRSTSINRLPTEAEWEYACRCRDHDLLSLWRHAAGEVSADERGVFSCR